MWKAVSDIVEVGGECFRKAVNDVVVAGDGEWVRKSLSGIVVVKMNV